MQRNPGLAAEIQTRLEEDIIAGQSFIRQLRAQPKDYISRFKSQLDQMGEYLPASALQEQTTVKKDFSVF